MRRPRVCLAALSVALVVGVTPASASSSRDMPACVVPNVVGDGLVAANKAIVHAHCKVGNVTKAYSKRVKTGFVVSEAPKPGKRLKNGGKVNLVVSRGLKPARKH